MFCKPYIKTKGGIIMDMMKAVIKPLYVFIGIVLFISVIAALWPTVYDKFTNLSTQSGLPFASMFASGGAALLIVGVVVLTSIIGYATMMRVKK
jgi:hypothetical protein